MLAGAAEAAITNRAELPSPQKVFTVTELMETLRPASFNPYRPQRIGKEASRRKTAFLLANRDCGSSQPQRPSVDTKPLTMKARARGKAPLVLFSRVAKTRQATAIKTQAENIEITLKPIWIRSALWLFHLIRRSGLVSNSPKPPTKNSLFYNKMLVKIALGLVGCVQGQETCNSLPRNANPLDAMLIQMSRNNHTSVTLIALL